ncbi:hypothetical protein [Polluticaenibacter yanchengensis]|uniref:Uncharacterized protein n=1 Tax=Polluticaenibacter yanchengensis TaxID=3014562 RepID=A0ABT4ULF2_9BACT|nr:hypothetical protein [Chitinophagaceae bacterium LY-5]
MKVLLLLPVAVIGLLFIRALFLATALSVTPTSRKNEQGTGMASFSFSANTNPYIKITLL